LIRLPTLSLLAAALLVMTQAAAFAAPSTGPVANLRAFAQDRPRACADAEATPPAAAGWRQDSRHCVWRGLLEMRSWSSPDATTGCTGPASLKWAWMRNRIPATVQTQSRAWNLAWPSNALQARSEHVQRLAFLGRNPDGSWSAREWTWTPSARAATRRWQQQRWDLLVHAVQATQPPAAPPEAREMAMVEAAWEDALRGRPATVEGHLWRWQENGVCLTIDTVGLSDAQIHMPYDASEGRHEQRSAMQLLMARRYPGADWLTPFRLLPQSPASTGGAKYWAMWVQQRDIRGQLWIPQKNEAAIIRVRVSAPLPPPLPGARTPEVFQQARAISAELGKLAAAWDARHER
jgi:hypothetical protein